MTRIEYGTRVVYVCDGLSEKPGDSHHAVTFVPNDKDAVPRGWYTLQHEMSPDHHFCDTDCLERYIQRNQKEFLHSLAEDMERYAREMNESEHE